jgi:hypothetical protein
MGFMDRRNNRLLLLCALLAAAGCADSGAVAPVAMSGTHSGWNLDSPVFITGDGTPRIAVTCKSNHRVVLFDALAPSRTTFLGRAGKGPGAFLRPNGIAALEIGGKQLLLVVERDNARLQLHEGAPGGRSIALLRHPVFRKPYGIAVQPDGAGTLLHVTDLLPDRLGNRVHTFRLLAPPQSPDGRHALQLIRSFGTAREGLSIPESIVFDPLHNRIVLCDETPGKGKLLVYDPEGRFLFTRGAGRFLHDPEGIAFAPLAEGGYLLAADQLPRTVIRVFHRKSLKYAGSTVLGKTSHTDGIAVGLVGGRALLAAVHLDAGVHVYAVRDIIRAMRR